MLDHCTHTFIVSLHILIQVFGSLISAQRSPLLCHLPLDRLSSRQHCWIFRGDLRDAAPVFPRPSSFVDCCTCSNKRRQHWYGQMYPRCAYERTCKTPLVVYLQLLILSEIDFRNPCCCQDVRVGSGAFVEYSEGVPEIYMCCRAGGCKEGSQ